MAGVTGERARHRRDLAGIARRRRRRCRARPKSRARRRKGRRRSPPRPWCCRCPSRRPPRRSVPPATASMPKAMVATQDSLVHGGVRDDVGRRHIEGEIEDLEAEVEAGADLVDRGASGGEVLEHLPVDLGRIGGDARAPRRRGLRRRPRRAVVRPSAAPCLARRRATRRAIRAGRGCRRAWSGCARARAPPRPRPRQGRASWLSIGACRRTACRPPRGSSGLLERRGASQGRGASIGGTRAGVKRCP